MSRARVLLLALAGLALPVGLALGVYAASAGSLAAVPVVVERPGPIARAATTNETAPTTTEQATTTGGERNEDLPGKCRKPENQLDPDCDPRTAEEDDDDSSGHGSGGDDRDDDDSSGPGSGDDDDSSGHGSGDDD